MSLSPSRCEIIVRMAEVGGGHGEFGAARAERRPPVPPEIQIPRPLSRRAIHARCMPSSVLYAAR